MNQSRELVRSLLKGLIAELKLYNSLNELLHQQYLLMRQHDSEKLANLNLSEMSLLVELKSLAGKRHQILSDLGLEPNADGMSLLIQKLPAGLSQQTANAWQELQHFYANCKLQNEQNGRLLVFQRETLERLLFGEPDRDYGMRQVTG